MGEEKTPGWAAALGRVPSGLFVLTARHKEYETGMLASWVQQCSFEPPMLAVAVRQGRPLDDWLQAGCSLVVNVIPEGGKALVAHFGRGFEPEQPAFEGVLVDRKSASAPVLADALAFLEGEPAGRTAAGDHVVYLIRITGGRVLHDGRPTMHMRKDGRRY